MMTILTAATINASALPAGFTYVTDPRLIYEMSYVGSDNFIGRPINGYKKKVCILTQQAATALLKVQDELDRTHPGYVLKIFDTYRPHRAVEDFIAWSTNPNDIINKALYYPDLTKPQIFEQGFIFPRSSHSRGSTVDLTIVVKAPDGNHKELEMGTRFDFFGAASFTASTEVSIEAQRNRKFLFDLMDKHGFQNLPEEWWHFTLRNEPFPETHFDFEVA